MDTALEMEHRLVLSERNLLSISGVKDVLAFDEESIRLETAAGRLTIKGSRLCITGFHKESGDFSATGDIGAAVYTAEPRHGGFWAGLFR